jgi:putative oxidoreductase
MDTKEKYTDIKRRIIGWREEHYRSKIIPIFRVLFGIGIIYKMLYFVHSGGAKMENILYNSTHYASWVFAHWIPMIGFAAGILIAVGLLTRVASLILLPIFLGAVLFSHSIGGYSAFEHSTFGISFILLIGSIFFSVFGSGYYSADRAVQEESRREEEFFWREK